MSLEGGGVRLEWTQHDGGRRGSQGSRVPPNFLRKSVPPAPARAASGLRPAALTATPATVPNILFSTMGTALLEIDMDGIHSIKSASDRVVAALISGLESAFGEGAGRALAQLVVAAEEADFRWEARSRERWLGHVEPIGDDAVELDRIAILGWFDGCWFTGICQVDGDGHPHAIGHVRECATLAEAEAAYAITD